jgi:cytochrome c
MRNFQVFKTLTVIFVSGFALYLFSCNSSDQEKKVEASAGEKPAMLKEEMIKRGDYIALTAGCHDCHSPKKFGPHGMSLDSSRLLSGHPSESPLPPVNVKSLEPGQWMSFSGDLTTWVGPWGMTNTANLTPDSATGIGAWTEAQFINTIRNGKHLGDGRPIMPPMPWEFIGKMTDDDLKAIYAFLNSLPPVKNPVHAPYSPDEVKGMATK